MWRREAPLRGASGVGVSEVSLAILQPLELELADRGQSLEQLVEGLPGARAELQGNRISWDLFARICERTEALLAPDLTLEELAFQRFSAAPFGMLQSALRAVLTPRDMYWIGTLWYGRHLFSVVDDRIEDLPDGRIREVLVIPAPYRECPQFFHIVHGALRAGPLLMDLEPAEVELTIDGRKATFLIDPGLPPTPKSPFREMVRSLVGTSRRSVLTQLIDQQSELQTTMRARQRISRIGRELAQQTDMGEVADALVRLLGSVVQCDGVRLWVRKGDEGELRVLRAGGVCKGASRRSIDLVTGDRSVGRLDLWWPDEVADRGLDEALDELTPWISIALDNARSQEELRRRVDEQRALLSAAHEDLASQEQMAALGTLAAGIAHEINNPVGAIQLAAEYGLNELSTADDGASDGAGRVAGVLSDVLDQALRCKEIVRNILLFARRDAVERRAGDLLPVVSTAVAALRDYAQSHGVIVVVDAADELSPVEMDAVQIQQVISNLLHNAVEASARGDRIQVELREVEGGVRTRVIDEGCGIAASDLERIFDPFFQTRQGSAGTGLGLAVVHGIVTQHGGRLVAKSVRGEGSTFEFTLPRAGGPALSPSVGE